MKNQAAVATTEPEMEVKHFTAAELRQLQKKMKIFNEARDEVNEFLEFLQEQHGIKGEKGWQMGDAGFFRQVPPTPAPNGNGASSNSKSKGKGKGKATEEVVTQVPTAPVAEQEVVEVAAVETAEAVPQP